MFHNFFGALVFIEVAAMEPKSKLFSLNCPKRYNYFTKIWKIMEPLWNFVFGKFIIQAEISALTETKLWEHSCMNTPTILCYDNLALIYDSPTISPFTTSIRSACGLFGSPGIRIIGPAMTTIISAPIFTVMSRTCNS